MERRSGVTLKQRADFPPAGDASFAGELSQGRLQEKDGDPAAHEEDDVGDEERSLMHPKRERKNSSASDFCIGSVLNLISAPPSPDFYVALF